MSRLRIIAPAAACVVAAVASVAAPASAKTVSVHFTGGHGTDPRDNGRPIRLVAAALGVPTDVFRDAFSKVTPAGAGDEPDPAQVQANKAALLKVLAPYGVTNDRLDEVSNYYRYVESAGELWRHRRATARATIKNGRVVAIHLTSAGAGYTTKPKVTVPGYSVGKVTMKLGYGKKLATNGRVRVLHAG